MVLASMKTVDICWHRGGSAPSLLECCGPGGEGGGEVQCQHMD